MFRQNAEMALLHAWVLPTGSGWWVGFAVEAGRYFFAEMFLAVLSGIMRLGFLSAVFISNVLSLSLVSRLFLSTLLTYQTLLVRSLFSLS
jgi:hypothetical protein